MSEQNFDQDIKRYYDINERSKKDSKVLKELSNKLKSIFKVGDSYKTEEGIELKISEQNRTSMNNDKLLEILKERGHTNAIKTVEVPDEKVVEELMFSGELTAEDVAPAVVTKQIPVLKVAWKGEKKNVKKTEKETDEKVTVSRTRNTF